jgi:uncharacterized caspase-like protein
VAVVIDNSAYGSVAKLDKPITDTGLIADGVKAVGIEPVDSATHRRALQQAARNFDAAATSSAHTPAAS